MAIGRASPRLKRAAPRARGAAAWMLIASTLAPMGRVRAQSSHAREIDLLSLASAAVDASLPTGWATRSVRGRPLPVSRIVDTLGVRFMRIQGEGHAGWFVKAMPGRDTAAAGHLHWTWRAPLPPRGADVSRPDTDDAALRVFVVFARHGRFALRPRVLYYVLADGTPAPDRVDAPVGLRIAGRPAVARDWVQARADPLADYRRVWGTSAPAIVGIGVMQDSDQTRQATIGDIKQLTWRYSDAPIP